MWDMKQSSGELRRRNSGPDWWGSSRDWDEKMKQERRPEWVPWPPWFWGQQLKTRKRGVWTQSEHTSLECGLTDCFDDAWGPLSQSCRREWAVRDHQYLRREEKTLFYTEWWFILLSDMKLEKVFSRCHLLWKRGVISGMFYAGELEVLNSLCFLMC